MDAQEFAYEQFSSNVVASETSKQIAGFTNAWFDYDAAILMGWVAPPHQKIVGDLNSESWMGITFFATIFLQWKLQAATR